jgi:hypothetical protein
MAYLKRLKVMAGCYPHVVLVTLPFNFDATALEDLAVRNFLNTPQT